MERIVFMRNRESAFWKKGMFFDGEVEQIIFFAKIVNRYFENKECFLAFQFQSFDGGSVRIKGTKTLYLPVVFIQVTQASIYLTWCDEGYNRTWLVKNLFWLVNQTCH